MSVYNVHVQLWKAHNRAAQVYMCTWSSPPPLSVDDLCTAAAAYFPRVYKCTCASLRSCRVTLRLWRGLANPPTTCDWRTFCLLLFETETDSSVTLEWWRFGCWLFLSLAPPLAVGNSSMNQVQGFRRRFQEPSLALLPRREGPPPRGITTRTSTSTWTRRGSTSRRRWRTTTSTRRRWTTTHCLCSTSGQPLKNLNYILVFYILVFFNLFLDLSIELICLFSSDS